MIFRRGDRFRLPTRGRWRTCLCGSNLRSSRSTQELSSALSNISGLYLIGSIFAWCSEASSLEVTCRGISVRAAHKSET